MHIAAHIFAVRMCDRFMGSELLADLLIKAALIRHKPRLAGDVFGHDGSHGHAVRVLRMKRTNAAAALYKGNNGALASGTSTAPINVGTALARGRRLRVL